MITLDLSILNQKGTPMFYSDTLAARPAFGIAGRIFIDIASPYGIYRDTGTAWVQIAATGTSGAITGGGTINTIAMFTPSGTAVGDSKITQSGSDINIDANVFVTNGNINLPANNTVGGTTYKIQQVMATNDGWSIYGNAVATDRGEVVFEVSDNGAQFNPDGQRYRFHYEANSSGTNKDVLIIDYNLSSFTTAIDVNHVHTALAGASNPYGQQISVTNTYNAGITWTALLACYNTSSFQSNLFNGSVTFGNASYTTNNLNLSSITFNAAGSTITNTQASGGIRAYANQILQLRINGTNNGTYTHYANSAIYGDFASSTARFIITNRYGYLVNDLDEYTAGHTYTNRWAFYNAGINDNNFFAGKVGIGSGYSPSTFQLDVIGNLRATELHIAGTNTYSIANGTNPAGNANSILFKTASTTLMSINSTGLTTFSGIDAFLSVVDRSGGAANAMGFYANQNTANLYSQSLLKNILSVGTTNGRITLGITNYNYNGNTSVDGKVNIIGEGSTSATNSLLIRNSSSTLLLGVSDNGNVSFGNFTSGAVVDISGSTSGRASLRIRSGDAPTSPNDGDIWFNGTNLFMRIGGVTKTFTII